MKYQRDNRLWADLFGKKLLLAAIALALLTHGIFLYFTLPKTYDAYVHIFFADHYKRFWFEPWEYRWYTGFLTISYPPLVHQAIALLSFLLPLKAAFCVFATLVILVLAIGVYRFTKVFFGKTTAGIAAILSVLLSSIVEALHVFGQLPTLTGIAFVLNALPFIYHYFRSRKRLYLFMGLAFLAVVVSAHHVTAIFGMVFFIAPMVFMALADGLPVHSDKSTWWTFLQAMWRQVFKVKWQILAFGSLMIVLAVSLIFPYWYWSKTDPITQVSIPHGSRDSFLQNPASAVVFFIIPLIVILALLPAILFLLFRQRRFLGWTVSFLLCLLLGSGGTTPIPRMLLGQNAFDILTFDRFGFWASIIALPFAAHFLNGFFSGHVRRVWVKRFSSAAHYLVSAAGGLSYLLFLVFVFHLGSFRDLQPKEIDIQPLLNFLHRDEHLRWRYLTLGFGDQMAWLSANTVAATVDGNYHSARRLPELTTRPIERLENAKFAGTEGLSSLRDFLASAEKYHLKYVFSYDRYYDPLLYYLGWNRVIRLENNIVVWEKGNVSKVKPVQPRELSPLMKFAWGVLPLSGLFMAFLLTTNYIRRHKGADDLLVPAEPSTAWPRYIALWVPLLPLAFFSIYIGKQAWELLYVRSLKTPEQTVNHFMNHLDFHRFREAYDLFVPDPVYTFDQYLLELSVTEGGLLPNYAKLDSLSTRLLSQRGDSATVRVQSFWRTSLGRRERTETMRLARHGSNWLLIPPEFRPEIPEEQMHKYTITLFKRMGKRVVSSFPTVTEDEIRKPFAAVRQVNILRFGKRHYITGEVVNADNVPVNIALRARVYHNDTSWTDFFPEEAYRYNLSPKVSSAFQIEIGRNIPIQKVDFFIETDVTERGYLHGGVLDWKLRDSARGRLAVDVGFYNDLAMRINIPGALLEERDATGTIVQVQTLLGDRAVASGQHISFTRAIAPAGGWVQRETRFPLRIYVNNRQRELQPNEQTGLAESIGGFRLYPHCFIGEELYLH